MLTKIFIALILCSRLASASSLDSYLELFSSQPKMMGPPGATCDGEIEILLAPERIEEVRGAKYEQLRALGLSPDYADKWTRVGVVAQDQYVWLIRDAVVLPTGQTTLYDRLVPNACKAAAILPMTNEGEVGLILIYRHATRRWELEIPRGGVKTAKTSEEAAKIELEEETGLQGFDWMLLGEMNSDSGLLANTVPIYFAHVKKSDPTFSCPFEAIRSVHFFSMKELHQALIAGEVRVKEKEREIVARLADPFLTYGLYLYGISKSR